MADKKIFSIGNIFIAAETEEEAYNIYNEKLPESAKKYPKTYSKGLEILGNKERGTRYNEGKPRWGLVWYKGFIPMIRVLEIGAKEYGEENWKKGLVKREILESMQRHLASLMDGEELDAQSGLPHMGHIQANAMFYNYMIDQKSNDK